MQSIKSQSSTPFILTFPNSLHEKIRFLAELKTDIKPLSLLSVINQLNMLVPNESGILAKILRSNAEEVFNNTYALLTQGSGSDIEKLIDLHAADNDSDLHNIFLSNPDLLDRFKTMSSDTSKQCSNYHEHLIFCLANNPSISTKLIDFVIKKIGVEKFCFPSTESKLQVEKNLEKLESLLSNRSDDFFNNDSDFFQAFNLINSIVDKKSFWISYATTWLNKLSPIITRLNLAVDQAKQYKGNNPEIISSIQDVMFKLSKFNIFYSSDSINIKDIESKIQSLKTKWDKLINLSKETDEEDNESSIPTEQNILEDHIDEFLTCIKSAHQIKTSLSSTYFIENYSHPLNNLLKSIDKIFYFALDLEPDSDEIDNESPQARIYQEGLSLDLIEFASPSDYPLLNQLLILHSLIKNSDANYEQLNTFSEILKNFLALEHLTNNRSEDDFEELCIKSLVELALHKNANEAFSSNIYEFLNLKKESSSFGLFAKHEYSFWPSVGRIISDSRTHIRLETAVNLVNFKTPRSSVLLAPRHHLFLSPNMTIEYLTKSISDNSNSLSLKLLKKHGNSLPDKLFDGFFKQAQYSPLEFFTADNISVRKKLDVFSKNKDSINADLRPLIEKILQACQIYEIAKINKDSYTLKSLEFFFENPKDNEHLLLSIADFQNDITKSPDNLKINHFLKLINFNKIKFEEIDSAILSIIDKNPLEFVESISENKTFPLNKLTFFVESLTKKINELFLKNKSSIDFARKCSIQTDLANLTGQCKKILFNHGAKLTSDQIVALCEAGSTNMNLDKEESSKVFASDTLYKIGFDQNVYKAIFEKWGMLYSYMPSGNAGDPYIPQVVNNHIK